MCLNSVLITYNNCLKITSVGKKFKSFLEEKIEMEGKPDPPKIQDADVWHMLFTTIITGGNEGK